MPNRRHVLICYLSLGVLLVALLVGLFASGSDLMYKRISLRRYHAKFEGHAFENPVLIGKFRLAGTTFASGPSGNRSYYSGPCFVDSVDGRGHVKRRHGHRLLLEAERRGNILRVVLNPPLR